MVERAVAYSFSLLAAWQATSFHFVNHIIMVCNIYIVDRLMQHHQAIRINVFGA